MILIFLHKLRRVPRAAKVLCLAVLGLSCLMFGLQMSAVNSSYVIYFLYPPALIGLAIGAFLVAKPYPRLVLRSAEDKEYMAAGMTLLWGVGYFLLGLLFTYTRNPLVASPLSVVINMWAYIIPIAALEVVRFSALRIAGRTRLWFGAVVLLALATLQVAVLPTMVGIRAEDIIPRFTSVVLPILLYNAVATYLCVFAGLRAALLFHVGIYIILTALPIVPKFDWYLVGMGALILSMMIYFTVGSTRQDRRLSFRGKVVGKEGVVANAVTAVFVVFFVLFMANVFTYQPLAIMSDSMRTTYARGDLVIVKTIKDTDVIKIGDIIRYQKDTTTITHRVVAVTHSEGGGGRVYTTKGDNNRSADAWPVTPDMIGGIIVAKVPLVGFPSIWLYEILHPASTVQEGVVHGS